MSPTLSSVFLELRDRLRPLAHLLEFRRGVFEATAHLERVVPLLDPAAPRRRLLRSALDPAAAPAGGSFESMSDEHRVVVREAFISVLALGQRLRDPGLDPCVPHATYELAELAVAELLDQLTPYVSRTDDALRRVLLDDEPLEVALASAGARR